jgi:hypothetical protein
MKAKNPLKIQVNEPCMQSWSAMTPDNSGRFCGACSKTVIDFSTYTDQQLIEFFTQSRTERVCGRFQSGQLDRALGTGRSWWSWVRSIAALLLPFLLTSKADAQRIDSTAQIDKRNAEKVRIGQEPRVLGMVLPNRIQLVTEKKNPKADIDPRFQQGRTQEAIEPRRKGKVRIIR